MIDLRIDNQRDKAEKKKTENEQKDKISRYKHNK